MLLNVRNKFVKYIVMPCESCIISLKSIMSFLHLPSLVEPTMLNTFLSIFIEQFLVFLVFVSFTIRSSSKYEPNMCSMIFYILDNTAPVLYSIAWHTTSYINFAHVVTFPFSGKANVIGDNFRGKPTVIRSVGIHGT